MWADVQPGLRKRCCQNWEQPRWVQEAWISVRMVQTQPLTIALLAKQPRVCHAGCPLVQRALWTQTLFSHLPREGEKSHTHTKKNQSNPNTWTGYQHSPRMKPDCVQSHSWAAQVLEFGIKTTQGCINHSDRQLLALSLHTYKVPARRAVPCRNGWSFSFTWSWTTHR